MDYLATAFHFIWKCLGAGEIAMASPVHLSPSGYEKKISHNRN